MAKVIYSRSEPGKIGSGLLPSKNDILLYQGDDFSVNLAFGSSKTSRIDMTGWTGSCQFRRTVNADPINATVTIATDGKKLSLSLDKTLTSAMSGKYVYDLQLTTADGDTRTFMHGEAEVLPEVTKGV